MGREAAVRWIRGCAALRGMLDGPGAAEAFVNVSRVVV